ncbi:MAG: MFS transporter [Desulfobulbaceae bacterium]|nr:MAG: MFS transporter [Desulfobulbaceae bacterium]
MDRQRSMVIWAALLALFLGALDALIMSAAMPSIVAELAGLELYAWVYSAYFLTRAVSLPVFGKLADVYSVKKLFLFSIILFTVASVIAGLSNSMWMLIISRAFQGIGAGGNFALVYIVLSHVSEPSNRAKTLSLASSIWGISSVIGPTLGGFIVTYFSWRWIFFINLPVGLLSLAGIALFLQSKERVEKETSLDLTGVMLFTTFVLGLLCIFITGGRELPWLSPSMAILVIFTLVMGILFYRQEKRAEKPMIHLSFFTQRNFTMGISATFLASFTIFSLFAYVPLYIQGSLGLSPMQVGLAMVSLSLGWSFGALFYGRLSKKGAERLWSIWGGLVLLAGSVMMLRFNLGTSMLECFAVFLIIGIGMGLVSLSTLIVVQDSVSNKHLGIATSLHQFGRSLGGTVGVGVCGGILTTRLFGNLAKVETLPDEMVAGLERSVESMLQPGFHALIPDEALVSLKNALLAGVYSTFILCTLSSLLCFFSCVLLKKSTDG